MNSTNPNTTQDDRTAWGRWTFNPGALCLELTDERGHVLYELDLEQCVTSAHVLDWIFQVASKRLSVTRTDVADLVYALEDLLRPQSTLCSYGGDSAIPAGEIRELVLENERSELIWRKAEAQHDDEQAVIRAAEIAAGIDLRHAGRAVSIARLVQIGDLVALEVDAALARRGSA